MEPMESTESTELMELLDLLELMELTEPMELLELLDLLELMEFVPEERQPEIVSRLPDGKRAELGRAELYPESSAGRVMTTSFVALDEKMTAQEAIDSIRSGGDDNGSILYLYVVDDQRALRGVVPIRRLVSAPSDRPVGELMVSEPVSGSAAGRSAATASVGASTRGR